VAEPVGLLLVVAAAIAGGALNSVAGGGTFLTFPALLLAGVPPIPANATSTVAMFPGSVASAGGYREELHATRHLLLPLGAASIAGGFAGAALLLLTPPPTFAALVPWLLLGATLLFAIGPKVTARLRRGTVAPEDAVPPRRLAALAMFQFFVGVYGGYFGAGIGILMLAALGLMGMTRIHAMNGLKVVLGSVINGVAVIAFALAGIVDWTFAAPMVVGAVLGGYGGARLARRMEPGLVRSFVVVVGLVLSALFFARGV
jgi:uncharacterized protein